ncbi:MAG: B12-binding domain-containing radical SAM protein [Clostridia bacterium]|nr:B12-binding domain-containing radical SAM protein [Clostridia bacterium]
MEKPFIVGFSCYMWNIDYNLSLAKAIKAEWPDCVIALGGPQVPNDFEIPEEYDFVDILMHGEGEVTFYELLKALAEDKKLENVHNISYRDNGTLTRTETFAASSLEDFPSPYTTGLFDSIINNPAYKDIQFDTVLETTRGCPYNTCVYCCRSGVKHKFRTFPEARVLGDPDWMAKNRICFCICADSNFGILDRDEKIADYITNLKKQYGYPQKFETIATKNKSDLTFRINSKLETANLNRGISLAIQSFSPDVLKIIGRQNIPYENFAKELTRYRNGGMFTYTDLILGLPGETLESFCKGMFEVIEAGQHDSININRCELLPNSKMYEKDFVETYKIKTIRSALCQNHSKIYENALNSSRSQLVVETATLPMQDWRTALRISVCVQSFHCFGLLKFLAIYLRKAHNVSYYDFYMNLYAWIERESSFLKQTVDTVCASIDKFLQKEGNLPFLIVY